MSVPPVAVIGVAAAVGLFAGAVSEPDTAPPSLSFAAWGEKCAAESLGLSPEVWTRRGDSERISAGRYVEPIPINCVLAAWRPTALARWAEAGDPVALLAVSYDALTETETPCRRLPQVQRDLMRAYGARRRDFALDAPTSTAGPLARVPEAAVLLAQTQAACGHRDQAAHILAEAQALGFEVRAVRLEVDGAPGD